MALATVLMLSTTLKPSKAIPSPDTGCKSLDNQQVCLATLKNFEKTRNGWVLYLEGNQPYTVTSSKVPKNKVGRTLQLTLEITSLGWAVIDWETKY